jgi:hypothetical protein
MIRSLFILACRRDDGRAPATRLALSGLNRSMSAERVTMSENR